ncbi:hypothetical protein RHOSPDRAFT_31990 [Rhodotorula sp. JG-1b]|nr:hypothetical protein RHOSPDRAFT_31990 [Rhodotorula sp. JG-1b]
MATRPVFTPVTTRAEVVIRCSPPLDLVVRGHLHRLTSSARLSSLWGSVPPPPPSTTVLDPTLPPAATQTARITAKCYIRPSRYGLFVVRLPCRQETTSITVRLCLLAAESAKTSTRVSPPASDKGKGKEVFALLSKGRNRPDYEPIEHCCEPSLHRSRSASSWTFSLPAIQSSRTFSSTHPPIQNLSYLAGAGVTAGDKYTLRAEKIANETDRVDPAKSDLIYLSTVLLPLIESLLVVNKFTEASSTDKILDTMVRNHLSLMSGSFAVLVRNLSKLDLKNKRSFFFSGLRNRSQRARPHDPVFNLNIRRARAFEDSYHVFLRKTGDKIKYHLEYLSFVGRNIGRAIHKQRLLEAHFSLAVYKHVLGKRPEQSRQERKQEQLPAQDRGPAGLGRDQGLDGRAPEWSATTSSALFSERKLKSC